MNAKSEAFFEAYAAVRELNAQAYDRIRADIRCGDTEKALYDAVVDTYLSATDGKAQYTGDFISGRRSCDIEGAATDKVLENGDTVIVDALVAVDGVHCDTTRTFFCGEPSERQRQVYAVLCRILEEAARRLKPGVRACDIFRFVDEEISKAGYGGLVHHAGHSLGYAWCEEPRFVAENETVLEEDMLVALEPGIYLENEFGIRIENNYRVTAQGGVNVFGYTTAIDAFVLK